MARTGRRADGAAVRPPAGRRRDDALASTGAIERDLRLALIVGFAGVAVVFLWLLVQAPWTSLEWTDGLALRYALPILVGAAFVAYLGLFPRQFACTTTR